MPSQSFNLEEIPSTTNWTDLKPGVYLQNQAFLFGGDDAADLVSLEHALSLVRLGEATAVPIMSFLQGNL